MDSWRALEDGATWDELLDELEAVLAEGSVDQARDVTARLRTWGTRASGQREKDATFGLLGDHAQRVRHFERLFETTSLLPAVAGFDGHFKQLGPRWEALLGWTEAELTSSPYISFVHPDDVDATYAETAKLTRGIDVISFENRYQCRDGGYRRLRWYASIDAAAQLIYAVGIDVTAEYVAQRRLELSERLLRDTGTLARVGGFELDSDLGTMSWSPQVFEIHDLPVGVPPSPDEILTLYPPSVRPTVREALDACLTRGEIRDLVLPLETIKGNRRWVKVQLRPTWSAGTIVGVHGAMQDVTESKQREEELQAAKEAALESARFKSRFLANMSHEVRTPLNGILGTLQLVEDMPMPPEAAEMVGVARHCAENLLGIVNDVLDLAKIEAGQMQLEHVLFDPVRLVHDAVRGFHGLASVKGLTVQANISPRISGYYQGDPGRLRQILCNLVNNAVKFTEQGSVEVSLQAGEDKGLIFSVRDSGIGIPAEKQAEVFDAFRQADSTVARRFGGSGLGLAICRELLAMMGAQLDLDSVPGRGSVFSFYVGLSPVSVVAEVLTAPAESGRYTQYRSLSILLAEDNDVNALVAERMITGLGHQVTRVADGRQAIEVVCRGGFDLVLMDVQMPRVDGLEATREIRRHEEHAQLGRTPIIALTANAYDEDAAACLAAGMDRHIAKPIRRAELSRILASYTRLPTTVA